MSGMRLKLEGAMQPLAAALDNALPDLVGTDERVGFLVMLFEFGKEGGYLAYASNGDRDDMIKTVEEWLARAKTGLMTDPRGPRGKS